MSDRQATGNMLMSCGKGGRSHKYVVLASGACSSLPNNSLQGKQAGTERSFTLTLKETGTTLVVTSASLVVTGALLVVTRSY